MTRFDFTAFKFLHLSIYHFIEAIIESPLFHKTRRVTPVARSLHKLTPRSLLVSSILINRRYARKEIEWALKVMAINLFLLIFSPVLESVNRRDGQLVQPTYRTDFF